MSLIKETELMECGLTRNEAKVYLAMLKLGPAKAIEITKKSGVHRVNVYDVLERLQDKGLVSTVVKFNKRFYHPSNPEQLLNLIREKEETLSKILPSLKEEFFSKKETQEVYYFTGIDGVMRAYFMMLDQGQTIYGLGGSGLTRNFLKHRHEMWNKERRKRRIKGKMLYYEFTKDDSVSGWKDSTMEIRYLPDEFKTNCMIDICGDLVINLLPIENNIGAVVVKNNTLADGYRKFFNFAWKHARV